MVRKVLFRPLLFAQYNRGVNKILFPVALNIFFTIDFQEK